MWPIHDWQFWVVTGICVAVLAFFVRARLTGKRTGCSGCAATTRKQA